MARAEGARNRTISTRTRTTHQAQTAIRQARARWGLWADAVLQEAEAAYGTGYDPADPVILEDGQYADALDVGTELDQALPDVTALIEHLWRIEQRAAEDAR